jgi:diketogulonate reductase-like aldo/keto reductase
MRFGPKGPRPPQWLGHSAALHSQAIAPAQVILRWHLQMENIAIPGSSNPAHILENISIFDFELTEEEMRSMSVLDTGRGTYDFSNADGEPNFSPFRPMNFNDQE